MEGKNDVHPRHHVRRPPGVGGDRAGEPRHLRARGPVRPRAREGGRVPRHARQAAARTSRSSATCAAPATSRRSSWSRTRRPRRASPTRSREELLRGFMSGELYKHGLICRADDRGDPVIQLSPPLIADTRGVRDDRPRPAPGAHRGLGADRPPLIRCSPYEGLVAEMGLELAAGEDGADAPVRWVHITELPDPTPWLSGGELLLTTGHPARHRRAPARVRAAAGGAPPRRPRLRHRLRPRDAARRRWSRRRAQLGFPVFEVPYELPFIAITEKAFARLVNEQYEVLQRGIAIHKRLERLVLEERGLDEVVRALAAATGGAVCVLSGARRDDRLEGVPAPAARARRSSRCATRCAGASSRGNGARSENAEFAPDHPEHRRPLAGAARVAARRAARRRPGSWRRATPAASATSSG